MTPLALWVVPTAEIGGVARHVLDVARVGLPGWRLSVAAPPGPLATALTGLGCEVHLIETGDPENESRVALVANMRRAVADLRALITSVKPKVVHSHLARADLWCQLATARLPVSLVSTEHGIAPPGTYHSTLQVAHTRRLMHAIMARRCARLIAVSDSTAALMQQHWHSPKPTVIRNGIDRPASQPRSNHRPRRPGFRFLSLTRLAPEKNLDLVLSAFALVAKRQPEASLTVAGTGPLAAELVDRADALGLNRVSFPGVVASDEALANHDVLVQPSVWENCSYSLLDATKFGLGIVATDVGGNSEFLPSQLLLVDVTPEAVAAQMLSQAVHLNRRPALPAGWPTVPEMTRHIVACYGRPDGVELRHQSG